MSHDQPLRPYGVFAAAATAVSGNYSIDLGRTTAHWFRLLDAGCHHLAVFGTTGEANSLSLAERMGTLEAAVNTGVPVERLWPGTGCCALPDAIQLTRHAVSMGAPGVLVLPPFYYKSLTDEGLAAWYSTLIEQVADPNLSVVLYHFPALSGVPITPGAIKILLQRFPKNITGIKDSTAELDSALQFREAFPEISILPGGDPLLLPVLDQGGAGCITAIANIASPLLRLIWDCHDQPTRRHEAEAAHEIVCELRNVLSGPDLLARVKAVIGMQRNDEAWAQVRLPLRTLDQTALQELRESLAPILERMQTVLAASATTSSVSTAERVSQ